MPRHEAVPLLQRLYAEPIKPELIAACVQQMREAHITVAAALSPQKTHDFIQDVVAAGVDMFVIRGTTVSAEHVSAQLEPLNLAVHHELDVPVLVGGRHVPVRPASHACWRGRGAGRVRRRREPYDCRCAGSPGSHGNRGGRRGAARRDYLDESGGGTCT